MASVRCSFALSLKLLTKKLVEQDPEVDVSYMIEQLVDKDPQFYNKIRDDLITQSSSWARGFSLQHVESVKSMQDNLNALALIVRFPTFTKIFGLVRFGKATFIAAVQAQVITYSYQSNSTNLEVAINAIFFTGLFLDITGGCMAYIVSLQLQHIYALLLRRTTSISQIVNALDQYTPPPGVDPSRLKAVANLPSVSIHILFLEIVFLHALTNPSAWERSLTEMRTSQRDIEEIILFLDKRLHIRANVHLQEYQRTTNELDKSRAAVSIANFAIVTLRMIVLVGVACCVVGGLCFVRDAQPSGVWITSFTVLGGILILFVIIMGHATLRSYFGVRAY